MHLKRQEMPKSWPVFRKGTKYVVRPSSGFNQGIPLLLVLRDMLNIVQNRKEAKRAIFLKNILLNGKIPGDDRVPVQLFDTIAIVPEKKNYRMDLSEKGKFKLHEITESQAMRKVVKVIDKRVLKGKKIQLNLQDGRNFLSDVKCGVNDSVLVNVKEKKVEKCLPLKENSNAIVFAGKHAGKRGEIKSIDKAKNMAEIHAAGEKISVLIKQIIITE